MDSHAGHARVAGLEAALPGLAGRARAQALSELAWHLRERDTKRAYAIASEVAAMLVAADDADARALAARVDLTLGECAVLFRDTEAARAAAARALESFGAAGDIAGTVDAHLLRVRIARLLRDPAAAHAEALAARRAADQGGDAVRQALSAAALAALSPRTPDAAPPPPGVDAPAAGCVLAHVAAQGHIQQGDVESAMEALARVAAEAPLHGMDELALESELAMARIFGALQDLETALERAERVLAQARTRGWRGLLASATASVCDWLLATGEPTRAVELLREARASLEAVAASHADAWLERLLGEALLAAGHGEDAAAALARAIDLLAAQDAPPAEIAIARSREARALARAGRMDTALERAGEALAAARAAGSRAAEMEALATLGELHAADAADARSAIAFLRHAAEIAEELDDCGRRHALSRQLARLHEAAGDWSLALGAERSAHAEAERAVRHRARDLRLAAAARCIAERVRLERAHAEAAGGTAQRHGKDLQDAYATLERMRQMAHGVAQAPDAPTLVERIDRHLAGIADVHFVGLYVMDAAGRGLTRYAREAGRAIPVRDVAAGDLESYAARAARERREMHVELESAAPGAGELHDSATLWFGPVASGEEILGVLTLQSRRPHAYGERERLVFRGLCGDAAVALGNARLREALRVQRELRVETEERLRRLATVDAPTGLATRAHFFAVARERLERARHDGGPCGLVIADVDAFKAINDIHGHAAGDRVLAAVAAVIAAQLHGDDVAGRIGGEEFALLLPGATLEATVAAAERMRLAIESHAIAHDARPVMVTMSFGCTAVAHRTDRVAGETAASTLERMVREADAALYEAQGTGGNRAIAWPAYEALRALRLGEALSSDPQSCA